MIGDPQPPSASIAGLLGEACKAPYPVLQMNIRTSRLRVTSQAQDEQAFTQAEGKELLNKPVWYAKNAVRVSFVFGLLPRGNLECLHLPPTSPTRISMSPFDVAALPLECQGLATRNPSSSSLPAHWSPQLLVYSLAHPDSEGAATQQHLTSGQGSMQSTQRATQSTLYITVTHGPFAIQHASPCAMLPRVLSSSHLLNS
ncbi:hypothetical protein F4780DRAFT_306496 [Xylariomycetidae sp. FL0641]|nr:hypothetical protein F4780DRAFT_306496 [Xylariomycetidae sp. FL0641]